MKKRQEGIKIKLTLIGGVIAILLVLLIAIIMQNIKRANIIKANPELGRAMNYEEFTDNDAKVEGTENIKFSAFFLRDINQDGYAEKIKGTCKQIGKEDTLYMEINVETAGMLKNAKIEIQGNNFYLQTALPKDNELKDNYIGDNVKTIEFNDLNNGTQKLLTGIVRSGNYSYGSSKSEAIGNNINNLSRKDNKVILTGTYVDENNEEIPIRKEVDLETDWYGVTKANINATTQNKSIENVIDEESGKVNLDFTIYTNETQNELLLSKNYVEGEIPKLNEYEPTRVEYTSNVGTFNYNKETRKFTIERTSKVDEQGNITSSLSRSNSYGIKVEYPLEAYQTLGTETIQIKIPIKTYYEGYNNTNKEFTNPYKSNVANSTIVVNYEKAKGKVSRFDITVGKSMYSPSYRYVVSKEKPLRIYNGKSAEEKDDTYTVLWQAYIGTGENLPGIVMKETKNGEQQVKDKFIKTDSTEESTEDVVSNVGIYFNGADTILGEDGWIKIYNEETGDLIVTFTKNEWNKYSSSNPYKYEIPVKNIRIETSNVVSDESYLYVYNIKEIDDNKITEKYTKEQFNELQYIKSTLAGYLGETYINTDVHQAKYEAPISVADIHISKNTISTQATEKNEIITIETEANTSYNEVKWKDGTFLVKFPEEIIDVQINNVEITNPNVSIETYELIEKDDEKYIKIVTKNDNPETYEIKIDVDLSPDPRKATSTRNIKLYASNDYGENYYYSAQDVYDVNNNLNTTEKVNYRETSISMVSPNSLLTNQIASNYDEKGSQVISPQIADIKPIYAVVDQEQEVQTVKIGVQLKNNYASTTSEIQILGKIPFEGNTYVINGGNLESTFTTKLQKTGIELPEELKGIATVYYSENENPDREIGKEENGWKKAEAVTNWDNIKTYLIDLGNYVMPTGKEIVFNYVVEIPNGLRFNEVSYSHHAVYFCLDTDEGKYKTETEPNRLGLRIAEKYNLELTKYQTGKDKLVPGATYRITDEETGESKTGVTNAEGKLTVQNLYAEKAYIIQEIKTPDNYELNSNIIRFIGHVDNEGKLSIEQTEGLTKGDITVTKADGEEYKVNVQLEDEVKATVKLYKKEMGTDNLIKGVRFKLTGDNLGENGKNVTTNINGEAVLRGLSVNKEYILEEIRAEGYYLSSPIKFKIVNNNGSYSIEVLEGENFVQNTVEEDGIPTINITLENEKIPTYDLELVKIKRVTLVEEGENGTQVGLEEKAIANAEETEYLQGAKFKLYKGTEEIGSYTTDATGKVTISGLYVYETDKNVDQTYTLKEVLAPDGYAKVKDITFKVINENGELVLKELNEDGEEIDSTRYTAEENTIKLTIQDSPSFKLIKKDGETGEVLPNTKFAIYNVDEGEVEARNSKGEIIGTKEVINGKEYYTVTTDAKGELTLDLPEGLYKAVEVKASDEKYDISESTYYFGIGGSREGKTRQKIEWATNIGGIGYDYITTVNELKEGGYIVGGYFRSNSIIIGEYNIENHGSQYNDAFIVKYNNDKEVEWAKSIGGSKDDETIGIIETYDNGIIVCINSNSWSVNLDDETVINNNGNNYNGIIIKYDSMGNLVWSRKLNENKNENKITSIAEDVNGELIITGYICDSLDFIENTTLNSNGNKDGMIAKFDSEGKLIWGKSIGGIENDELLTIDIVNTDKIIVGGYFSNKINVNGNELEAQGNMDGLILQFNSQGEIIWKDIIGSKEEDKIVSLSKDSTDGFIVGGYFSESLNLSNQEKIESKGEEDAVVIKYNKNNEIEWNRHFGGIYSEGINSVDTMTDGGYIIGGYFGSNKIEIGNGEVLGNKTINSGNDGMIIKYNSLGEYEWYKEIGTVYSEEINTVFGTKDGGMLAGGYYSRAGITLDGTIKLKQTGGDGGDGLLIKYEKVEGEDIEVKRAESLQANSDIYLYKTIKTQDGGYLTVGAFDADIKTDTVEIINNGRRDVMLIKCDKLGKVQWSRAIGGNNTEYFNSVTETVDGNFVVGMKSYSSSINLGNGNNIYRKKNKTLILVSYNSTGELQWSQQLEGNELSVSKSEDGGFFATGDLKDLADGKEANIAKLNKNGELEWYQKTEYTIESILETKDKGYIVVGKFKDNIVLDDKILLKSEGDTDGIIVKYNSNNQIEWAKRVGGEDLDYVDVIKEDKNGNFVAIADFESNKVILENGQELKNSSGTISAIMKYNKEGKLLWGATMGNGTFQKRKW